MNVLGDLSWNLDQALLWVATRDPEVVADASWPDPITTWMETAAGWAINEEVRPDWRAVEATLLLAVQQGQLSVRNDLEAVQASWFDPSVQALGPT
jgi:hypothetical protein